eukprot:scaffold596_cov378-Prasinococcus_capsulatus_cf.AAC.11
MLVQQCVAHAGHALCRKALRDVAAAAYTTPLAPQPLQQLVIEGAVLLRRRRLWRFHLLAFCPYARRERRQQQ